MIYDKTLQEIISTCLEGQDYREINRRIQNSEKHKDLNEMITKYLD